MNVFALLLTLNVFVLILQVRFCKNLSAFENIALNLLFLVSVYAVFITQLKTIYLIPFIGVPACFFVKGFAVSYPDKNEVWRSLLVANGIWLVFFILYFVLGDFQIRVPHVDFIISTRIAFYNDLFGVENTQGYYNLFNGKITNEIYHHFELWLMNMGHFVNGQSRIRNSFFFSFPLIAFVSFAGIKELLKSDRILSPLLVLLCALAISSPYDYVNRGFNLGLPLSALGGLLFNLKLAVVVPIILYVINGLKKEKLEGVFVCLITFYYPLVIPVLLPTLIVYQFIMNGFKVKSNLILPIVFTLIAGIFMLTNGGGPSGLDLSSIFQLKKALKILAMGAVVPAISFGLIFLVKYQSIIIDKKLLLLFFGIANLMALSVWFLLHQNIDANQFFSIPFSPLLAILCALAIYELISRRIYWAAVISILIYLTPFVVGCFTIEFLSRPAYAKALVSEIPSNEKILYIPLEYEVNHIFDYTERMSNPINPIFLFREDLHIINIAASFKPKFKSDNDTRKTMFEYSRKISPYFQACGEFDLKNSTCLYDFLKNNKIKYVLADANFEFDDRLKKITDNVEGRSLFYFE
jgi:hypothetical protein